MEKRIRFKFAAEKALAAIHYMVCESPGIDLHGMMKTCYFADKSHLEKHKRPVFGATYRAMRFGPVPLEIYEMAKGESYWLAELQVDSLPWRLDGYKLHLADTQTNSCAPDLGALSKTDIDEIQSALQLACSLSFDARTRATHGDDWQRAELGIMQYEDMIPESPNKGELVAYLRETAHNLRL
ncbi:type II toxin-antitoxin system antitoxin SocA domain-containing protein [Hyphomonas chukchiensis]|uniref:Antitoxin SocA-like Panacea domain-containing protein n=1 Tax=Hyphomonas chukchiensis TaxID=1280947 RepID=A0A062UFV3_9PROT|nr:Panacea domain-containing protein [Hyphomonas chukchiensis]KCZ60833.1 hypothetical protein HY30_00440 [Hyphomonas chukchiensis]